MWSVNTMTYRQLNFFCTVLMNGNRVTSNLTRVPCLTREWLTDISVNGYECVCVCVWVGAWVRAYICVWVHTWYVCALIKHTHASNTITGAAGNIHVLIPVWLTDHMHTLTLWPPKSSCFSISCSSFNFLIFCCPVTLNLSTYKRLECTYATQLW